jgi:hypothetical protein
VLRASCCSPEGTPAVELRPNHRRPCQSSDANLHGRLTQELYISARKARIARPLDTRTMGVAPTYDHRESVRGVIASVGRSDTHAAAEGVVTGPLMWT